MTYEQLREEFCGEAFRAKYWETHERRCVNCGSTDGITLHHVVPLSRGGTNADGNIVPVCGKCHKAVHFGKHMNRYKQTNYTGRPRTCDKETAHYVITMYLSGQITRGQAESAMGCGESTKLYDAASYKEYLRTHGIKKAHMFLGSYNDKHNSRGDLHMGVPVGVLTGDGWEHIVRYGYPMATVAFLVRRETA